MTRENEELKKRMSGVEEMVANLIVNQQAMAKAFQERGDRHTLGARAPIISGHMLNTLRIQSISNHNVSSGQKSDTFKMYPAM